MPKYSSQQRAQLAAEAQAALARHGGNEGRAAAELGLSRTSFRYRLRWSGVAADEVWAAYTRSRDPFARTQLVERYTPLVRKIAANVHRKLPRSVEVEDLVSEGMIGLLAALDKFEPSRGNKFETFATLRIRGAMIDYLRGLDDVSRRLRTRQKKAERLRAQGVEAEDADSQAGLDATDQQLLRLRVHSLDQVLFTTDSEQERTRADVIFAIEGHAGASRAVRCEQFERLTRGLLFDERVLLWLYYYGQDVTMRQIGELLGLSESRVSQLHGVAIAWLQRNRKLEDAS